MKGLRFFLALLFVLIGAISFAASRYWVAAGTSNWNNVSNWSATSGGPSGASVPGATDIAFFNAAGPGNCNIDIAVVVDGISTTGFIGVINLFNFSFNPASSGTVASTFGGGALVGSIGNSLSFSSNDLVTFGAMSINVPVNITASSVNFNGGIFNSPVSITNLGTAASVGVGGNVFNSTLDISSFGNNFFTMGVTNPDIFNDVTTLLNRGTSRVRVGFNATGNQFNDNLIVGSDAGNGISFGEGVGSTTLAALMTISIDPLGFTNGELLFQSFTQTGPTVQTLLLTGGSLFNSVNSTWGGNVDFRAPSIKTEGSNYTGTSILEKTGSGNDASLGNNVFSGNCFLYNSSNGTLSMGNVNPDSFNTDLTVESTGSNYVYIGISSTGNTIAGDLLINLDCIGLTGSTGIYICGGSASTVNVAGNTIVTSAATASTCNLHLGYNGALTLAGDLTINNNSVSNNFHINVGFLPSSIVTVNGNTTINHQGTGFANRVVLGAFADVTFNGDITVTNSSTATYSNIRFNFGVTSSNTYNGDIELNSSSPGNNFNGVNFGNNNGSGILTAGNSIGIGPGGFLDGFLSLKNFSQLGSTPQSILFPTLGAIFWMENCYFQSDFTYSGTSIFLFNSTFDGTTVVEKLSGLASLNNDGNTFNGVTTIQNSSAGDFNFGSITPNDYNSDVTFINNGSANLYPSYSSPSTYAGDITIESVAPMLMALTGAGRVVMDGTGPQSINLVPGSPAATIVYLQTLNPNDEITLNTPITVKKFLELTQGNIIADPVNYLAIDVGSVVVDVDDDAYVDGTCLKAGNTPFVFPVGDNGAYRPIEISGSTSFQVFTAEFKGNDVLVDGLPDLPIAATLDHISNCEYWNLDRIFGSVPVTVRLHYKDWGPGNCSGVNVPGELRVSKWDGSSWLDLGNGGNSGTPTIGWVQSGAAINSFSPFTLGTTTPNNPLPIELVSFEALVENESVRLNWVTSYEIDNDFFEIERSNNGTNFETILYQKGAGNSSSTINYTDLDRNPLYGLSYYRLKQVDLNGEVTFSDIKAITFDKDNSGVILVYPNPSKDIIVVRGYEDEIQDFKIFNLLGNEMTQAVKVISTGTQTRTLDLQSIPSGVYLLKTRNQVIRFTRL